MSVSAASSIARPPGRYHEECTPGQIIEHAVTRTITEADNTQFCRMTENTQPLHLDAEFARHSEFGQRLVNSLYTLGLMVGISVHDTTHGTLVANLGLADVRFPKPVFHGDTIHVRTTVVGVRASASRPGQGVVVFEHQAFNQHDVLVASCKRTVLLHSRPAAGA